MSEGLDLAVQPDWSSIDSLPITGGTMSGALNMGSNAISGVSTLAVTNTTNQITLGTTNTVTLNSTAPSTSRTYTINPIAGNGEFALISTSGGKKLSVSYEAVSAVSGVAINLTAAQLSSGIVAISFAFDGLSTFTLTLPTGADIAANAALAPFNTAGAVFKVLLSETGSFGEGIGSLVGSSGCNLVGGVTIVGGFTRVLYFVAAGSSVWNVY